MKIGNTQILSRSINTGTNTISFTDAQLDTIYKLYQNNNSLIATFVLTTANNYTNTKTCTITLKGNQKTVRNNMLSNWKRGKIWANVNGSWKKAVAWIKVNGIWRRGI